MNYNWNRLHYSWAQVEEGVKTFSLGCLDVITRKLLLYHVSRLCKNRNRHSPSPSTLKKKNAPACVEIYHATNGDISSTSSLRFITLRFSFLSLPNRKQNSFFAKYARNVLWTISLIVESRNSTIENTIANNRIFLEKLEEGKERKREGRVKGKWQKIDVERRTWTGRITFD